MGKNKDNNKENCSDKVKKRPELPKGQTISKVEGLFELNIKKK